MDQSTQFFGILVYVTLWIQKSVHMCANLTATKMTNFDQKIINKKKLSPVKFVFEFFCHLRQCCLSPRCNL